MHVVQLANFYGEHSGGLRTVVRELARQYVERGHRVTRIVPGAVDRQVELDGVVTLEIRSPLVPGMGGYRAVARPGRVVQLLRELAPDAIELSDKTSLAAAVATHRRVRGTRTVLISHERIDAILADRVPGFLPLRRGADLWNRRLAARVDAVVCASEFAADEFVRIAASNVHRIPLGVDLAQWRPITTDDGGPSIGGRPSVGARPEVARLVMVGRLSAEKRPELAIDTVRVLVERGVRVQLFVAGDGPMRDELLAAARHLPVELLGHVGDRVQLADIVRHADVVLAPCPVETFGLSVLEALASGTPVVVPGAGALRELVVDGAGVVVSGSGDRLADRFADGVERLLAGDREHQRLACRRRAEAFDWARTADAMLGLLCPDHSEAFADVE